MKKRTIEHICFISPKRDLWSKNPRIGNFLRECNKFLKAWHSPSLSVLTIAGLTPGNIRVSYIDADFEEIDYDTPYDIVGISAMTQQINHGYEIAREFRKRGVFVAIGGIHATVMSSEALQWADAVFIGESERTWPRFLEDFKNRQEKRVYKNDEPVSLEISGVPMPRYDLLKGKKYFKDAKLFYNMVPVQATRGCPHGCDFCLVTNIYGKKIRKKRIDQVLREIDEIKRQLPGKLIMFADDNLFVDRRFSKELLNELVGLQVRWVAQSDISIGEDEELLRLIYKSGGLFLLIGLESINENNLKQLNENSWKYRQYKNYTLNIEKIQKHGIIVFGSFILGLDDDDKTVFADVVKFMQENHITGQLTVATPLPGTKFLERLKIDNRLLVEEPFWDKCTFFDILYKPVRMNVSDLEEGLIWAYGQLFNEKAFEERSHYLKEIYKGI